MHFITRLVLTSSVNEALVSACCDHCCRLELVIEESNKLFKDIPVGDSAAKVRLICYRLLYMYKRYNFIMRGCNLIFSLTTNTHEKQPQKYTTAEHTLN